MFSAENAELHERETRCMELQWAYSLTIVFCSAVSILPVCAQVPTDINPELARRGSGAPYREVNVPTKRADGAGAATVSADALRHPLSPKAHGMLQKALRTMDSGDHHAAIKQLNLTLTKYPDSAAYVHSLLGVEYMRTEQYKDAMNSFQQATVLLPHDAVIRYNFGLSLVCNSLLDRGEVEVERAIQLDPGNRTMRSLYLSFKNARDRNPDSSQRVSGIRRQFQQSLGVQLETPHQ